MWSLYHVSNECEHHTDSPCLLSSLHCLILFVNIFAHSWVVQLLSIVTLHIDEHFWNRKFPLGDWYPPSPLLPSCLKVHALILVITPLHLHVHIQCTHIFVMHVHMLDSIFVMYFFLMVLGLFYHLRMTWQSELKRLKWQFKISVLVHMQQFLGMR